MLYLDVQWCLQIQKSLWNIETFRPTAYTCLEDATLHNQYIDAMENLMNPGVHLIDKEQLLLDLTAAIFKKSVLLPGDFQHHDPYTGKIKRLKELLASDLDKELTLDGLARQISANPYTMLRLFKAKTGITPHAFRTNCRIEQARKFLQQGLAIAEVALRCGFFDQSHLHRHFKAMTTLTPKAYQVNFIQ